MTSRRGRPQRAQIPTEPPPPPLDAFRRPDVLERLAQHPDTRPYVVDSGFREALEKLRTGSHEGGPRILQHDPRLVQALGVLNGIRVTASEADVRAAERVGDIKKRDAIQTADVEAARKYASVAEAKGAGNEYFKAGEPSKALACYLRARSLLEGKIATTATGASEAGAASSCGGASGAGSEVTADEEEEEEEEEVRRVRTLLAVLLSNSAAALLKLERHSEALDAGREALQAAPAGSEPLSKIQYRIAHAHEGLQQYDEALAAMELAKVEAVAAARRAQPACTGTGSDGAGSGSDGGAHDGAVSSGSGSEASGPRAAVLPVAVRAAAKPLVQELRRLERVRWAAKEAREGKAEQRRREAVSEARRVAGVPLGKAEPEAAAEATTIELSDRLSEVVTPPPPLPPPGTAVAAKAAAKAVAKAAAVPAGEGLPRIASVAEQDFSHWARRTLASRVVGLRHANAGATVVVDSFDEARSEVHASIKEKRGKRSLYYDLDLLLHWTGHCALDEAGRRTETHQTMKGEFRLYNVGQDTKFEVGGDPHTSYLYSLGFAAKFHKDEDCELWARLLKYEASELFELVSALVGAFVKDLIRKAEGRGELV